MNTWRTIWRKVTLWHRPHATDPQPSQSRKRTGPLRIVHDYRQLNEFTVMDVTPLPHISSILEELRGKALFSKFDIRAGYNNIRIRTEDTYKTGFKPTKDFTNGS